MVKCMKEVNLCSYFLLPLIGLSEHSFGESNFCNSYLAADEKAIYVKVYSTGLLPEEVKPDRALISVTGDSYLKYYFPAMWEEDFDKFRAGLYSRMSDSAKECIVQHSGLQYQVLYESSPVPFTDFRLLALVRSEVLRNEWRRHLYDPHEHCLLDTDSGLELLDAPGDYMFFADRITAEEVLK